MGWTVELKLNKKREKVGIQRGVASSLTHTHPPPLDPPLYTKDKDIRPIGLDIK